MPAHTGPNMGLRYGYASREEPWGDNMTADLKKLDALLHGAVKSRTLTAPPGSPLDGDRYIVGTGATGAWSGKDGWIAWYDGHASAWAYHEPKKGWRLFCEAEGRYVEHTGGGWTVASYVNAAMFASIQAAVDSLPNSGGVVYVPAGLYNATSPTTFTPGLVLGSTTKSNVTLIGDGPYATILESSSTSADMVKVKGSHVRLENLSLKGPNSAGAGRGVVVGRPTAESNDPVRHFIMTNCSIYETASWAFYVLGSDSAVEGAGNQVTANAAPILGALWDVVIFGFKSNGGVRLNRESVAWCFSNVTIGNGAGNCLKVQQSTAHRFYHCTFDAMSADDSPYIDLSASNNVSFIACYFERVGVVNSHFIVASGGFGTTIQDCYFARTGGATKARMLKMTGVAVSSLRFASNHCYIATTTADGTDDLKGDVVGNSFLVDSCSVGDNSAIRRLQIDDLGAEGQTILGQDNAIYLPYNDGAITGYRFGQLFFDTRDGFYVPAFYNGSSWRYAGIPKVTTTQRDAASWVDGDVVYNVTAAKLQVRVSGTWTDLH